MPSTGGDLDQILASFEAKETLRQLQILADRLGQLSDQVIIHGQRDQRLNEKIDELKAELTKMHGEISEIREYADKWRGGFYALAAMGGLLGAVIAFWDKVRAIWGH